MYTNEHINFDAVQFILNNYFKLSNIKNFPNDMESMNIEYMKIIFQEGYSISNNSHRLKCC